MGIKLRKKNNKWYVFVNYRGRRKAKCIGVSRQAAEEVRAKLEAKLKLGDLGFFEEPKKEITFEQYAERWLRRHADIYCKPSTAERYRQILRLYLLPVFGATALRNITRSQIKDFITDKAGEGRYSRDSLRLMLRTLGVIFNHALDDDDGLVDRNPAAKLGKLTNSEKPKRQGTALTQGEAERFLQATKEFCPPHYPLFLAALRAGLRRGELVALRWGDIQFAESEDDPNRYIMVQHNFVRGQFTSTKSKKARRVDLSRQLRSELLRLRDSSLLAAFQSGKTTITDDLVFPSRAGTVLDPDNLVHRYFLSLLKLARLQ